MFNATLNRIRQNDVSLIEVNDFNRPRSDTDNPRQLSPQEISQLGVALQGNIHVRALGLTFQGIGNEGAIVLSNVLSFDPGLRGCHVEFIYREPTDEEKDSVRSGRLLVIRRAQELRLGFFHVEHREYREEIIDLDQLSQDDPIRQFLLDIDVNEGDNIEVHNGAIKERLFEIAANFRALFGRRSHLEDLNLCGNRIGLEGIEHIANALRFNVSLTTLNLSWNNIRDEGIESIANSLLVNRSLRNLDLFHNGITDRGIIAFSSVLAQSAGLDELNLGDNAVTDEGMFHLCNALRSNRSLTSLKLYNTNITDKGVRYLQEMLQENTRLNSIEIVGSEKVIHMPPDGLLRRSDLPPRQAPHQDQPQDAAQGIDQPPGPAPMHDSTQRIGVDIASIHTRLGLADRCSQDAADSDSVFLIGPARVGKSTLANYLVGCRMRYIDAGDDNPGERCADVAEDETAPFKIGHGLASCTDITITKQIPVDIPNYPEINDQRNVAVSDCGGFFGNRSLETGVIESGSMMLTLRRLRSAKGILLVIPYRYIVGGSAGGQQFFTMFNMLNQFIRDKDAVFARMIVVITQRPLNVNVGACTKAISRNLNLHLERALQSVRQLGPNEVNQQGQDVEGLLKYADFLHRLIESQERQRFVIEDNYEEPGFRNEIFRQFSRVFGGQERFVPREAFLRRVRDGFGQMFSGIFDRMQQPENSSLGAEPLPPSRDLLMEDFNFSHFDPRNVPFGDQLSRLAIIGIGKIQELKNNQQSVQMARDRWGILSDGLLEYEELLTNIMEDGRLSVEERTRRALASIEQQIRANRGLIAQNRAAERAKSAERERLRIERDKFNIDRLLRYPEPNPTLRYPSVDENRSNTDTREYPMLHKDIIRFRNQQREALLRREKSELERQRDQYCQTRGDAEWSYGRTETYTWWRRLWVVSPWWAQFDFHVDNPDVSISRVDRRGGINNAGQPVGNWVGEERGYARGQYRVTYQSEHWANPARAGIDVWVETRRIPVHREIIMSLTNQFNMTTVQIGVLDSQHATLNAELADLLTRQTQLQGVLQNPTQHLDENAGIANMRERVESSKRVLAEHVIELDRNVETYLSLWARFKEKSMIYDFLDYMDRLSIFTSEHVRRFAEQYRAFKGGIVLREEEYMEDVNNEQNDSGRRRDPEDEGNARYGEGSSSRDSADRHEGGASREGNARYGESSSHGKNTSYSGGHYFSLSGNIQEREFCNIHDSRDVRFNRAQRWTDEQEKSPASGKSTVVFKTDMHRKDFVSNNIIERECDGGVSKGRAA